MKRNTKTAAAVVALHAAVNAGHGIPHAAIPVPLAAWQWAFVVAVVGVAPPVSVWALWRGRRKLGAVLLAVSMAASLAFGLYFHFVAPTNDHVAAIPAGPWQVPFRATALLAVVVDAVGVLLGVRMTSDSRRRATAVEA